MGRCLRPCWKLTSNVSFASGLPRTKAQGLAHGEPRGHFRGSNRGRRLAGNRPKYISFGVLPPSQVCGRNPWYHSTVARSSFMNASRRKDKRGRESFPLAVAYLCSPSPIAPWDAANRDRVDVAHFLLLKSPAQQRILFVLEMVQLGSLASAVGGKDQLAEIGNSALALTNCSDDCPRAAGNGKPWRENLGSERT
jgi:hypothetical protein